MVGVDIHFLFVNNLKEPQKRFYPRTFEILARSDKEYVRDKKKIGKVLFQIVWLILVRSGVDAIVCLLRR